MIPKSIATAKEIRLSPIDARTANAFVDAVHYSHTHTKNAQLHIGVFLGARLEGVMQFGPSLDKRKLQGLVRDTPWNGFLELNRLAFRDALPRNSESRALAIAFRMIRKNYPHIQWVVSFADGTQCGDGTIYRAAGFVLTSIKKNTTIWESEEGDIGTNISLRQTTNRVTMTKGANAIVGDGSASMRRFKDAGWRPKKGFQLRYIYFLDPGARSRLTVPEIPFSKIEEIGASMYKGQARGKQAMAESHSAQRRGSADHRAPTKSGPAKKGRAAKSDKRARATSKRRPSR